MFFKKDSSITITGDGNKFYGYELKQFTESESSQSLVNDFINFYLTNSLGQKINGCGKCN